MTGLLGRSWVYPTLEIIHIVGIALLLGNMVLLDLRVFGRGAALPLADLARLTLGTAIVGFTFAALSGLLMFSTQPQDLLANRAFTLKMLLLLAAGCNAAVFHARGSLQRLDRTAKLQLLVSTALWLAILTCGRWIAYR